MENYFITFVSFAQIIGSCALIWLAKVVINLKNGIDAQKNIIDSFKSQSDYIGNVQNVLSKMYDPEEIEKIISVKTDEKIKNEVEKFNRAENNSVQSMATMMSFISISTVYLSDSVIEAILDKVRNKKDGSELESFVRDCRAGVLKVRNEELKKLKYD